MEEKLTVFSRLLDEGVHAAFPIVSLWSHSGDVVPAHGFDDVHHGLGLVCVRRYHPGEEVVAGVVAELRGRWGITHLRNLPDRKKEPYYTQQTLFIHKEPEQLQFLRFHRWSKLIWIPNCSLTGSTLHSWLAALISPDNHRLGNNTSLEPFSVPATGICTQRHTGHEPVRWKSTHEQKREPSPTLR